jgi:hypothetical protein
VQAYFGNQEKIRSFNEHQHRADTATNTQTVAMPGFDAKLMATSKLRRVFFKSLRRKVYNNIQIIRQAHEQPMVKN